MNRLSLKNQHWHPFTDQQSAYFAGDFAALHDLQMREKYGDEWEQHEVIEYACCDGAVDDEYQQDLESLQSVEKPTIVAPETGDDWIPF